MEPDRLSANAFLFVVGESFHLKSNGDR